MKMIWSFRSAYKKMFGNRSPKDYTQDTLNKTVPGGSKGGRLISKKKRR